MLRNYVLVALRNLKRHRSYTILNVAGLAVGMACCLLIAGYVRQELRFDRFNTKADRLYRVVMDVKNGSDETKTSWMTPILGPTLENDLPDVETAVRVMNMRSKRLLKAGTTTFWETRIFETDSSFFKVFSYPLIAGDPNRVLTAPGSIVLTRSLALKYFGRVDVVGKTVLSNNERLLTVTGVMEDVPLESHLVFDGLVSLSTWASESSGEMENWGFNNLMTYVLLKPGVEAGGMAGKLKKLADRYMNPREEAGSFYVTLHLEPVTDIHLRSLYGGIGNQGNEDSVRLFALIAVFILLVACVNFTNLATARSLERAREVGVRKSVGARRSTLVGQFLAEAVLLSMLAFAAALGIVQAAAGSFEQLAGKEINWSVSPGEIGLMLLAVLITGLVAGSYPSFVLSRFQPVYVLKSSFSVRKGRNHVRSVLVVGQFAIAVGLIAATAIVFLQLRYVQGRSMGFRMHEGGELLVVDLPKDGSMNGQLETLKSRMEAHPKVSGVTMSGNTPASGGLSKNSGELEGPDGAPLTIAPVSWVVDPDFLQVYGVDIAAGRGFSSRFGTDSTAFLVNEAAVKEFAFSSPEKILGRSITMAGKTGNVIGVVKNFHIYSLHQEVPSIAFWLHPEWYSQLTIRVRPGDLNQTLSELENTWKTLAPDWPFQYRFMDESFDRQYEKDKQFGRVFGAFAGLAVFIACLGLLGLSAFSIQLRTKEIGVRKVLGASVSTILILLTGEFARLAAVGFVVAIPIVYFGMRRWLDGFAFRIHPGAYVFIAAGLAVLAIAFVTISYQSLKAARRNPVVSLRNE